MSLKDLADVELLTDYGEQYWQMFDRESPPGLAAEPSNPWEPIPSPSADPWKLATARRGRTGKLRSMFSDLERKIWAFRAGADRLQGKSSQKCGPRPSVPRNRRNSSRVRSERAGARPLGPRGRGTAAAGRVDGARRARAQIPGAGKGLNINLPRVSRVRSSVFDDAAVV